MRRLSSILASLVDSNRAVSVLSHEQITEYGSYLTKATHYSLGVKFAVPIFLYLAILYLAETVCRSQETALRTAYVISDIFVILN